MIAKQKALRHITIRLLYKSGNDLLSQGVSTQVSSALESLTSVFGMGTGVSSPLLSPETLFPQNCIMIKPFQEKTFIYFWSSPRPISTSQLHASLHFHSWPIYHVVYMGSYPFGGISHLRGGFTLRCLHRLSLPNLATQLCHWRDNWCTRGLSIPVLSY